MSKRIGLVKIGEDEYRVGENHAFLLDNNIVYVEAYGEQTGEIARLFREHYKIISEQLPGKFSYMINLNKCGKNYPEARKVWVEISERENIHKVALFGMHPVAKVIASFFMGISKSKGARFFKDKEDAMKWLNGHE